MSQAIDYFANHWFAGLSLGIAVLLAGLFLWIRRRQEESSRGLLFVASAFALFGLGGFTLPLLAPAVRAAGWGQSLEPAVLSLWVAGVVFGLALMVIFAKVFVLIVSGNWYAPAGYAAGVVLLLGLGGLCTPLIGAEL